MGHQRPWWHWWSPSLPHRPDIGTRSSRRTVKRWLHFSFAGSASRLMLRFTHRTARWLRKWRQPWPSRRRAPRMGHAAERTDATASFRHSDSDADDDMQRPVLQSCCGGGERLVLSPTQGDKVEPTSTLEQTGPNPESPPQRPRRIRGTGDHRPIGFDHRRASHVVGSSE